MKKSFLADGNDPLTSEKHHEETVTFQNNFKTDVFKLVDEIEELGNPFLEDSGMIFSLDTKDIMDKTVVQALRTARDIGHTQFNEFIKERINQAKNKPISDTVHKNKLATFSTYNVEQKTGTNTLIANLKADSKCTQFTTKGSKHG